MGLEKRVEKEENGRRQAIPKSPGTWLACYRHPDEEEEGGKRKWGGGLKGGRHHTFDTKFGQPLLLQGFRLHFIDSADLGETRPRRFFDRCFFPLLFFLFLLLVFVCFVGGRILTVLLVCHT
jgi:hypothetical protein